MEAFVNFIGTEALPFPGALPFGIGAGLLVLVGLLVAVVPVLRAVRDALANRGGGLEAPKLRVIEGKRELKARAA